MLFLKTLVIQNEKTRLQSELEKANKELAALRDKAVCFMCLFISVNFCAVQSKGK